MSFDATNKGVVYANLGLNSVALGSTAYTSAVTAATADGLRAYSNALVSAEQAALTDSDFATAVMANLGMTAAVIGQPAYDALQPALAAYVNAVGVANRGVVVVQLADIVAGLTADATFGAAATNLNNAAATAYVYSTNAANTDAKTIDVPTATAPASTFTLTTSATDNLVGTEFADVFTGVTSSLSTAATLQATDKIDGGAGEDVFKLDMNTDFTGFTTGSIKNVETVELTNKSAATRAFDASGVTGVSKYVLNAATGMVTLADVGTGFKTLEINDQAAGAFTSTFGAGASELTGTADSVALTLKNVGGTTSPAGTVSLALGGFETANVVSSGTANVVSLATSSLKTVSVSGSGKLTVAAVANGLTSFDASAATGSVTATLTGVTTASSLATVKGGAGSDSFTVDKADLAAYAVIDGGAGADTLSYTAAGGSAEYNMTGIETLTLVNTGATLNFAGGKTTGLTKVGTASTTTDAVNFLSMGAADLTFTASGVTNEAGDISSDHTGATTVTYSAAAATSTAKASADAPKADYTFAGSTGALTVNVGAYVTTTDSTITAAKASSVTVNVGSGKSADEATEYSSFNSTLTAAVATSISVDAAGTLGAAAVIDAAKATSATVVNGAVAGALQLNTAKLTSLKVTTGANLDLSTGVSDLSSLESLTVTANAGKVTLGNLAKAETVTLSGAGTSSQVQLGNLGATANAQDLTITASGLKSDLNVGNLVVGKGYGVTVTANAMAGDVTVGNVADATDIAKDVTINAAGGKATFTVGNIFASGTVSVDASNTVGKAEIGTVQGKSVTVNLEGSADTSVVGNITAKESANVTLNGLKANTNVINAGTDSTALSVTLKGGILADTITINGVSTQTGITVTGDLGASTDSLTVNSATSTKAQSINLSGLTNYDASVIYGGSAADTIVGGAGKDVIRGNAGADVLTGGAGADTFTFNAGHSTYAAMDTINDLEKVDTIVYEGANTRKGSANLDGSDTTKAKVVTGVATFDHITTATAKDSLLEVVNLVDAALTTAGDTALFAYDGVTYLFVNDDAVSSDTLIKVVGVNLNDLGDWKFSGVDAGVDTGIIGIGG